MESVDYCPMGSPVLDKTNHLGVTGSRYSLWRSPAERILLLTGLYHTLDALLVALIAVWWTAWRETQWGQMDGPSDPVVACSRNRLFWTVAAARAIEARLYPASALYRPLSVSILRWFASVSLEP
jgi:hypothetical protein